MQKIVLLSAITGLLCACSPREEPCDLTGQRYSKMMREGTPLTAKDQACVQANMIRSMDDMVKGAQEAQKKHFKGDEKTLPRK